ncbi:hypothetical protein BD779DRAFT_1478367 [Infundibulicybe gibba]|nr:hypothetical protein BD779DRAFT_1478367 [Infundibulicybe gibba]
MLEDPRFDWFTSFSSKWNDELLYLLAVDFLPKLKDTEAIKFEEEWRDVDYIKDKIARKLMHTRCEYKDRAPPDPSSSESLAVKTSRVKKNKERVHKQTRRNSRRSGTYERRKRIIKERLHENPRFWRRAGELLSELGEEGMSSNETETEGSSLMPKTVISAFWEAVECCGRVLSTVPGNSGFRIYTPHASSRNPKERVCCVPNLPGNYYCDLWWRSLSKAKQSAVGKKPDQDLPPIDYLMAMECAD